MQTESAAGDESRSLSSGRGVLDAVRQDVRYATRLFVKAPVFTSAAVLALALGIGTTTAMFSIVNTLLLRPLPYVDADKLVRVVDNLPADAPGGARQVPSGFEGDEFLDLRDHSATLSYIGVYVGANTTLTGRGEPLPLVGQRMSADFFPMLGLSPVLGRVFTREEEVPGRDNVVVLSNRLWQRLFDGAPTALGQPVILDGQPYTVIGVMPARFDFPTADVDVWLPFRPAPVPGRSQRYYVYGRVAPSATMEAAAREVSQFLQERRGFSSVEEYIAAGELLPFGLVSLQSEILAPVRPAVILFAVAVGVVLLIACVDVGNLLLVHGAGRSREVGIRMALGAGRRRLFLQGLTESCTLAIFGGVLSIWVALASIRVLRVLGTGLARRDLAAGVTIPRLAEVELDWRVLGFAVLVSLVTGIVCGTLPAWRYARAEPLHALRDEAAVRSAGTPLTRAFGAHALLVAGQVSLAIVLLICAGLLIRSFVNLSQIDPGYDDRSILTFQPSFPQGRYVGDRLSDFNEAVTAQIREMPGVRGVAYAYGLPMTQSRAGTRIRTSAAPPDPPRPLGSAPTAEYPNMRHVSHDFLGVMGINVLEGRTFADTDRAGQPMVMVVNRQFAASGYLGPSPVGKLVYINQLGPWEIVGVVEDVRQYGLDQAAEPQIFLDPRQSPPLPRADGIGPYFVVKTEGDPLSLTSSLRAAIMRVDPESTLVNVATMQQIVSNSISRPRLYASLLGGFAWLAMVLSVTGVYGVMAHTVSQRTREIGVRMALGSSRRRVVRDVLGRVLVTAVIGVLAGVAGAVAMSRFLESMLFGLVPTDPLTFLMVPVIFVAVAGAAALIPLRRAANVDPLVALREP